MRLKSLNKVKDMKRLNKCIGKEWNGKECIELSNRSCILYYGIVGLFGILVIFRFLSFIVFTTYDTKCMILEQHASVIDCHQDGIVPHPEFWISAWIIISVISSILFLIIFHIANNLKLVNFLGEKVCSAWRNASFISFFVLFLLTLIYYVFQIVSKRFTGLTLFFLLVWPIVMFLVVWRLNYTPQLRWKSDNCRPANFPLVNCPHQNCPPEVCRQRVAEITLFLFYWIALVMYFIEATCKLLAVTLDVAYDVVPVIEGRFPYESMKGLSVIFLGFRLAFHARLVYFFWDKICHGDKDTFSEPCSKLEDDQTGLTTTISTQTERVAEAFISTKLKRSLSAPTLTKTDKPVPPTSTPSDSNTLPPSPTPSDSNTQPPSPTPSDSNTPPSSPTPSDSNTPSPSPRPPSAPKAKKLKRAPAPTLLRGGLFGFFVTRGKKKKRHWKAG
ncbi:Hypothetical predicted protein [Paramuricea clavata]|uniref:Uncharacterized protein n=1 Tax=Paramuricea clavata TaxID=317549 RepID=A0A6S7I2N4_PARCT|nr:Hypothetical predicted protein [Paramuricea clavata]